MKAAEPVATLPSLAAVYRRVSTDHQTGSMDAQQQRLLGYLASRKLTATPETTFEDEDTSGSIPIFERPGGRQLKHVLEHGVSVKGQLGLTPAPVKHLVVCMLDRLGRSAPDLLELRDWLQSGQIVLHIVDFNGDIITSQGSFGKFLFGMLALFAEFELDMIRDRTRNSLLNKFNAGALTGSTPYGFDVQVEDDVKRLVPNVTEQHWLRWMHERKTLDNWNFNQIAVALNERQVPTKKGVIGGWQTGNVKSTLTNKHTVRFLEQSK
jgi:site-specific DNA recombinase